MTLCPLLAAFKALFFKDFNYDQLEYILFPISLSLVCVP